MEIHNEKKALARQAAVQPTDVAAGLGAANRELLATCIALFEDTSLAHRVGALFDRTKDWAKRKADEWQGAPRLSPDEVRRVAESIHTRSHQWLESGFDDAQLRLALWMYLREAFELPALTCASTRSAARSCDDLTAHLIHSLEPGWFHRLVDKTLRRESPPPVTLDAVARQTLEELMREVLDGTDSMATRQREKLVEEARDRVQHLGEQDRKALLDAIGAKELNDAAIRKILLTGGGLTLFSAGVGWAGFSAYILAAQVSAFIPLVSGPALVSLVSVLSNPVSVIAIAGGGGWWMAEHVQRRVSQAVAMRVIALLAMNGLCAGPSGLRAMAGAFRSLPRLRPFCDLESETIEKYLQDWERLKPAWSRNLPNAPAVAAVMEQPPFGSFSARLVHMMGVDAEELNDTAALSVLTVGDVLWHMYAINPFVLQAADFSHVADLGNVVDFAAFADKVTAMDTASQIGEVSDLKGYVAERLVASQLTDAGYQVEFPADPNQAGWDISVDGVQVQIKDTDSLSYLQQHFEHYGTQYPVIVNSEMAQSLADHHQAWIAAHPDWAEHVYVVDGYSNELVQHVTRLSLDAGAGINHPHVPLFTLAVSAHRNYRRFRGGQITGEQAVQQVLLDGGTKMVLASVGGAIGPAIGLFVFGPAGALILGSVLPIVSSMQSRHLQGVLDKYLTGPRYLAWSKEARLALGALVQTLRATIQAKAEALKAQAASLNSDTVSGYLRWRAEDELACLREAWCRLKMIKAEGAENVEAAVAHLFAWLGGATIHPVTYQKELQVLADVFKRRPSFVDRLK